MLGLVYCMRLNPRVSLSPYTRAVHGWWWPNPLILVLSDYGALLRQRQNMNLPKVKVGFLIITAMIPISGSRRFVI